MSGDPENLTLVLLREMRAEMADMRANMATKHDLENGIAAMRNEIADVRSEMHSLRADVASDLMTLEKRLGDQITGLRRSVMEYHSSVIGHGVLITEFEERIRRLERHVGLTPDGH